jgi:hypothetical protein
VLRAVDREEDSSKTGAFMHDRKRVARSPAFISAARHVATCRSDPVL